MRKYRLRIGLDVDDTLYECNAYALTLLREKYGDHPALTLENIHSWGALDNILDERLRYFGDPRFVAAQPIYPGAQAFVHELTRIADVFFITAVPPSCMSVRAERLRADFPDVPESNILIGNRKDIIDMDILLDDAAHNIVDTRATYPVLMRRPWNNDLSGLLSVNSYGDFVHLAQLIGNSFAETTPDLSTGGVLCLVGPSGAGKNELAAALVKDARFFKPTTTTTRAPLSGEAANAYRFIAAEQFLREKDRGAFVETTVYGTHYFGTTLDEFAPRIEAGRIAVVPIDICGAVTVKNLYRSRAMLAFCTRDKRNILRNILARSTDDEDKVHRLISLDYEMRNMELCDFVLDVDRGIPACVEDVYRGLGL